LEKKKVRSGKKEIGSTNRGIMIHRDDPPTVVVRTGKRSDVRGKAGTG